MRLDTFFSFFEQTAQDPKAPYDYDSFYKNFGQIDETGGNCASTPSAIGAEMGLPYWGGTVAFKDLLLAQQPYNPGAAYPRGMVCLNYMAGDYTGGEDFSHVGFVYNQDQWFIHCYGPQGYNGTGIDAHHSDSHYRWMGPWTYWTQNWAGYQVVGVVPELGVDFNPTYFDVGDIDLTSDYPTATRGDWWIPPELLAVFLACRAETKWQVPGEYAVACALVELTSALAPGSYGLYELGGYWHPLDSDSRGLFQQQSYIGGELTNWGAPEVTRDPNGALDSFCKAMRLVRQDSDANLHRPNDEEAGELIADVQQPAWEYRYRYTEALPQARDLIEAGYALLPVKYQWRDGEVEEDPPGPEPDEPLEGWELRGYFNNLPQVKFPLYQDGAMDRASWLEIVPKSQATDDDEILVVRRTW